MRRNLLIVSLMVLGTATMYPAFGVDSALIEHRQMLKEHYDVNNDGVISASELQAFREDRSAKVQERRETVAENVSQGCSPVVVLSGGSSGAVCNGGSVSSGSGVSCNRNTLDRVENVRDRRENRWDRREDRWDAQHNGGVLDRAEDVRDRREDRWDRRENRWDRRH